MLSLAYCVRGFGNARVNASERSFHVTLVPASPGVRCRTEFQGSLAPRLSTNFKPPPQGPSHHQPPFIASQASAPATTLHFLQCGARQDVCMFEAAVEFRQPASRLSFLAFAASARYRYSSTSYETHRGFDSGAAVYKRYSSCHWWKLLTKRRNTCC